MAAHDPTYFPDLPRIFAGEEQILSWSEIAERLLSRTNISPEPLLLTGQGWLSHLLPASPGFGVQDKNDNTAFETKTAAISISTTIGEHYDLAQIKEDSLWLSSELNLDPVEALRITLLEWQTRPQCLLQAGYSETEVASLHGVYGSDLAFDAELQGMLFRLRSEDEFKTQSARRCRQVFLYFKESIGLTRIQLILSDDFTLLSRITEGRIKRYSLGSYLHGIVGFMTGMIRSITEGPKWSVIDSHTNYVWQVGHLHLIATLMELVIAACRATDHIPSTALEAWVDALSSVGFFSDVEPSPLLSAEQVQRIHILTALTSIALIDPANTIAEIESPAGPADSSWLRNSELIAKIQNVLYECIAQTCVRAVPMAFVWTLCLHKVRQKASECKDRRDSPVVQRAQEAFATSDSSTYRQGSLTTPIQSCFEDAIDAVYLTEVHDNDPISTILSLTLQSVNMPETLAAIMMEASECLMPSTIAFRSQILQEVVAATLTVLPDSYGPETLLPQFAILMPQQQSPRTIQVNEYEACTTFLNNPFLLANVFDVAASRFPHEAVPFLRLCRLLAGAKAFDGATQYITYRLRDMEFFTHAKQGPLGDYHTVREDENLNLVELENNCYAFPTEPKMLRISGRQYRNTTIVIPAGTIGEIISDAEPPVVRWQHRYSGLTIIGEWLELHFNGVLHDALAAHESVTDVVADTILLLAQLLTTTNQAVDATSSTRDAAVDTILDESSANLSFGSSIVDLIFEILEQELQAYRRRPISSLDTSILHATIEFITAYLEVRPTHFWLRIMTTSIAKTGGSSSLLYALVNGIEGLSGTAPVTEATAKLFSTIVHAATRRSSSSVREVSGFLKSDLKLLNNQSRLFDEMLHNFTLTMLELYEILPTWKQLSSQQENRIVTQLNETFRSLIYLSYGVGSSQSSLTACYRRAAELIVMRLGAVSVSDAKSGALLQYLLPATRTDDSFTVDQNMNLRTLSCLDLALLILNVTGTERSRPIGLHSCLFDFCPALVRKINLSYRQQFPAARLLSVLLASTSRQKPHSLLGQLGPTTCITLLHWLSACSLSHESNVAAMAWNVLANFVSREQQWLSIVILTGAIPDKELKTSKSDSVAYRGRLFVKSAMVCVVRPELWDYKTNKHDQDLARSILRFLGVAQQHWSWALPSTSTTTEMFQLLANYVIKAGLSTPETIISRNQVTALVVDLGSIVLQHAKSTRNVTLMRVFFPLVKWLTQNAIDVSGYNTSLHSNLPKNFANKFGYDVSYFRRTTLLSRDEDGYYDIELADAILDGETGWKLEGRHEYQSYFSELVRANVNLATVESEIVLLRSFKNLCIEHAGFFAQDTGIRTTMAHIIQKCLAANTRAYPSEELFDHVFQSRIELALALMKCLVQVSAHGSDFRNLLIPAWQCVVFRNSSYELAVANDDLLYWQTSLCVVLLALRFHIGPGWKPLGSMPMSPGELLKHTEQAIPEVVDIAAVVVGDGLATTTTIILEQKQAEMEQRPLLNILSVGARDVTLILNTLETILRMSRLPDFAMQISERLLSTGVTKSCTKLFALSHLLVDKTSENASSYAVLGARLLASVSTLQPVAEEMAVEGVLSQMLTARMTQALQRMPEGVSSLDQRHVNSTLYTIWSAGVLPLALNLLHAVKGPIAAETSVFLNAFPQQLNLLINAFQPRPDRLITLSLAKEIATLSLVSFILEDYRSAGASIGVDSATVLPLNGFDENKKALVENLKEILRLDREILKAKLVPTTDKELAWHRGNELADKVTTELRSAISCLERNDPLDGTQPQAYEDG